MGSKASILKKLCAIFPKADNFYDLFGGGFSVTHFMLENRNKDFKQFHFNEIRPGVNELIQDSIAGKYSYDNFKPKFISREEFFKKKDSDAYVKMCWSFGNNGRGYMFGDIENYKKSMHNAIIFNEFDELAEKVLGMKRFSQGYSVYDKRIFLRSRIEYYRLNGIPEFLRHFLSEKQLEQLQQLQRLELYNRDYREVPLKENSVIYCDPPYIGTAMYDDEFDHKDFYEWAAAQDNPVFISEYKLEDPRFTCVMNIRKRSLMSANQDNPMFKTEKVFVNKAGLKALRKMRHERT